VSDPVQAGHIINSHGLAGVPQVYDVGPIAAGGLHTSLAVPPLLATFYLVLGGLLLWADAMLEDDPATQQAQHRAENPFYTAASFGVLALNLAVGAFMFERSYPYWQISAVLAALAAANWKLFDGTKQGIALAAVCALVAPAAELVLLQIWPLWHYARPDVLGFVSWVPWCYFFYTPAVSNLARCVYVNSMEEDQVR
jgi:heat shock protein 5